MTTFDNTEKEWNITIG